MFSQEEASSDGAYRAITTPHYTLVRPSLRTELALLAASPEEMKKRKTKAVCSAWHLTAASMCIY
jgi:hypothetical protein